MTDTEEDILTLRRVLRKIDRMREGVYSRVAVQFLTNVIEWREGKRTSPLNLFKDVPAWKS